MPSFLCGIIQKRTKKGTRKGTRPEKITAKTTENGRLIKIPNPVISFQQNPDKLTRDAEFTGFFLLFMYSKIPTI
jgi:hypothetical protein